ncbi:PREDICTED: cleavage stimulating factor 64-like [Ipomoea nil]|uniref:cleavage stimulating factor 64-like n=1 Tax=Ipomoea nil TaxID=35883 RepID=UPI000901D801|nr:PREDICTED: cleavage stimulating factor 64-like [Ipomoea nil]
MANPDSQRRCVFVGNMPYNTTEEKLVKICEEIGPVVSLRLVTDRETGKPKGYGFCEYNDEETALSARRNLQGYEINGRQLKVDFAENHKISDKNREEGRGGHEPIGHAVATTAATAMAGALGAAQMDSSLHNHPIDPLSLYLSKMSRSELYEIISDMKAIATQNKEQARQILHTIPNLPKAIFQAQLMLGLVTPQMLPQAGIVQSAAFQPSLAPSSSALSTPLDNIIKGCLETQIVANNSASLNKTIPTSGLPKRARAPNDSIDAMNHRPSKLSKLNDGRSCYSPPELNVVLRREEASSFEKHALQITPDVESALLQQVMSLTPQQLNSLPQDQQQQVFQLQRMLRQSA